jgi:hypothetical protein
MRSLRNVTIGIRAQAATVVALVVLWYVSCGFVIHHAKERGSDFWAGAAFYLLPISLVFTAILWWSYFRSDGAHAPWVYVATCFGLSPVMLFLLMLLA